MGIFSRDSISIKKNECIIRFELCGSLNYDRVTGLIGNKASKYTSATVQIGPFVSSGYVYMHPSACVASYSVDENNATFKSIDGNLYSKDGKKLIKYASFKKDTRFVVPQGVEEILLCAFWGANNLTEIILPNSLRIVHDQAFYECLGLKEIFLPEGVTQVDSAFIYCKNLEKIRFSKTVVKIKTSYKNYNGEEIENDIFSNCHSLLSIEVDEENPEYMSVDGNLYSKNGKRLIKYAVGKKDEGFVVPKGVCFIGYGAFSHCKNLKSVEMSDGVKSIGACAFMECSGLKRIELSTYIKRIGSCAFEKCKSLEEIIIPLEVSIIDGYAFKDCSSLTIRCKAKEKPEGWHNDWAGSTKNIEWGHRIHRSKSLNDE